MPEQDRARWDSAFMAEAFSCLDFAASGEELSRFHVEAAIAACHAMGSTYATFARVMTGVKQTLARVEAEVQHKCSSNMPLGKAPRSPDVGALRVRPSRTLQ